MAGGQERVLRRRIKSVQSTRKITKAMELIAASQIPRSLARIIANRPYRLGMQRIILEAASGDPAGARKLLALPDKIDDAAVLVVTGDRGLSGPYNNASLRAGERLVAKLQSQGTACGSSRLERRGRRSFASAASRSKTASSASSIVLSTQTRSASRRRSRTVLERRRPRSAPRLDALPLGRFAGRRDRAAFAARRARAPRDERAEGAARLHRVRT